MAQNISGFGLTVRLVANTTIPVGLEITQFADDADPLDMAAIQINDKAMGLNGDLVNWATATPIPMSLNVIPGSEDDQQLAILFQANRVGRGKRGADDEITAVVTYADGSFVALDGGIMESGPVGKSVASAGRQKSKTYLFAFENYVENPIGN